MADLENPAYEGDDFDGDFDDDDFDTPIMTIQSHFYMNMED